MPAVTGEEGAVRAALMAIREPLAKVISDGRDNAEPIRTFVDSSAFAEVERLSGRVHPPGPSGAAQFVDTGYSGGLSQLLDAKVGKPLAEVFMREHAGRWGSHDGFLQAAQQGVDELLRQLG
jgi:hypothetical protein